MSDGWTSRIRGPYVEMSAELNNPLFWANELIAFSASDECPAPHTTLLGVTDSEANEYYRKTLMPLLAEGRRAMAFPASLGDSRSVSIDLIPDPDPEIQLWILDSNGQRSACIGVQSGHFELPAIRPAELAWLISNLHDAHPAYGLMLCSMCYFESATDAPIELIEQCISSIPMARGEGASAISTSIVGINTIVDAAIWYRDPKLGWCSGNMYSPRNPSVAHVYGLDFAFVADFFKDVDASSAHAPIQASE